MPAIAMTDHGNLHGAFDFYAKAPQHGVKPIIGIEAYLTPDTSPFRQAAGSAGARRRAEEGGTTSPAAAPTPT